LDPCRFENKFPLTLLDSVDIRRGDISTINRKEKGENEFNGIKKFNLNLT